MRLYFTGYEKELGNQSLDTAGLVPARVPPAPPPPKFYKLAPKVAGIYRKSLISQIFFFFFFSPKQVVADPLLELV